MICADCGARVCISDGITVDGVRLCDQHARRAQLEQRADRSRSDAPSRAGGRP